MKTEQVKQLRTLLQHFIDDFTDPTKDLNASLRVIEELAKYDIYTKINVVSGGRYTVTMRHNEPILDEDDGTEIKDPRKYRTTNKNLALAICVAASRIVPYLGSENNDNQS